jgi:hypothetical protein
VAVAGPGGGGLVDAALGLMPLDIAELVGQALLAKQQAAARPKGIHQVRKTPSWPRSRANFSRL